MGGTTGCRAGQNLLPQVSITQYTCMYSIIQRNESYIPDNQNVFYHVHDWLLKKEFKDVNLQWTLREFITIKAINYIVNVAACSRQKLIHCIHQLPLIH